MGNTQVREATRMHGQIATRHAVNKVQQRPPRYHHKRRAHTHTYTKPKTTTEASLVASANSPRRSRRACPSPCWPGRPPARSRPRPAPRRGPAARAGRRPRGLAGRRGVGRKEKVVRLSECDCEGDCQGLGGCAERGERARGHIETRRDAGLGDRSQGAINRCSSEELETRGYRRTKERSFLCSTRLRRRLPRRAS